MIVSGHFPVKPESLKSYRKYMQNTRKINCNW